MCQSLRCGRTIHITNRVSSGADEHWSDRIVSRPLALRQRLESRRTRSSRPVVALSADGAHRGLLEMVLAFTSSVSESGTFMASLKFH